MKSKRETMNLSYKIYFKSIVVNNVAHEKEASVTFFLIRLTEKYLLKYLRRFAID